MLCAELTSKTDVSKKMHFILMLDSCLHNYGKSIGDLYFFLSQIRSCCLILFGVYFTAFMFPPNGLLHV